MFSLISILIRVGQDNSSQINLQHLLPINILAIQSKILYIRNFRDDLFIINCTILCTVILSNTDLNWKLTSISRLDLAESEVLHNLLFIYSLFIFHFGKRINKFFSFTALHNISIYYPSRFLFLLILYWWLTRSFLLMKDTKKMHNGEFW